MRLVTVYIQCSCCTPSYYNMEDPSAQFLAMVMDRMQTLEAANTLLQHQVDSLQATQCLHAQALSLGLHVRLNGGTELSDEACVHWEVGKPVATLVEMSDSEEWEEKVMDGEHAAATVFFGQYKVRWEDPSQGLGSVEFVVGKDGQRTTLKEFVETINRRVLDAPIGSLVRSLESQWVNAFMGVAPGLLEIKTFWC